MTYLLWYDDNPRRTAAEKIAGGVGAYRARFGAAPSVVLVNEQDRTAVAGIEVRVEGYVRRNNFWIGEHHGT